MYGISRSKVESLRKQYPNGTRVRLIEMNDPYTRMVPGMQGTVFGVDDMGQIMVRWDNGSMLSVIPGVDRIAKVK